MADEHMTNQNSDALENLPPGELQDHIIEQKKKIRRSFWLALSALIAIIVVCIAWFAANTQVSVSGTNVEAANDIPFELASVGVRQNGELDYLKDENNQNILSSGNQSNGKPYTYGKYVDINLETNTGTEVQQTQDYHVGYNSLAWYLSGQESLAPGASGRLEFYIIPKKSNLSQVTITVNLEGYKSDSVSSRAVKITDAPDLQQLLTGHILFFKSLDDTYGYHGWLGGDNTFAVKAPTSEQGKTGTFEENVPYKITIYWVWPQYFRNYVYTYRSTQNDLFTDAINQDDGSEYASFIGFWNKNKNKLFYTSEKQNTGGFENTFKLEISNKMSGTTLDSFSTYYNQADEYIGKTAQYVYVQIDVN